MTKIPQLFLLMQKENLTSKALSQATKISEGNISDWKSGRSMPSADKLIILAEFFHCSIDYLLGRTDNPQISSNNSTNINQQYISGNATANIVSDNNERNDADVKELLDMIKQLSIVQRAEIILKINEMMNEK